jgi:hypothetical protein
VFGGAALPVGPAEIPDCGNECADLRAA